MEVVQLTVSVPKETHELAKGVVDLAVAIIAKKKDGLTVAEIISAIGESMGSLMTAVDGIQALPEEMKMAALGSATAFTIEGQRVLDAMKV